MPGSVAPLDLAAVQVPYHFRCPISLELMRDPVTVATGQTYDRPSIESWIATGNTTCPVTRSPLPDFSLIPNHTLRRLIQDWCVAHRSLGVERIPTPKQPADPSLVRALLAQASSPFPSPSRLPALRRLRSLARDSDHNRLVISTPDNRAALLALAFPASADGGPPSDIALESLSVISMLPLSEQESASVASRPDRLSWLAALLSSHPSAETRADAAAMIEGVSTGTRSPDLRVAIGSIEGVMEGLLRTLDRDNIRVPRAGKAAVKALFSLCLVKPNRERAVSLRAAESLVDRVASGDMDRSDLERALATVELLCRVDGGCEALVAHAGTVGALVKVLAAKVSDRAAEHAAGALVVVCAASEALQREAVAKGVLGRLLLMVQSDCTERAKRKAQLLLKLLRAAWPHHDSLANSDDFQVQPAAATASSLC